MTNVRFKYLTAQNGCQQKNKKNFAMFERAIPNMFTLEEKTQIRMGGLLFLPCFVELGKLGHEGRNLYVLRTVGHA